MKFIRSVQCAWHGIKYCFKSEKNFRMELIIASITFSFAIALKIGVNEWLAILFCSALVLSLEIINTAIEKLSNIVTMSIHPVIKLIKDMAAGAVFLVSIISLIIGAIIFLPKIEFLIKNIFK
ncbi:MAG TPA: diacylglycerol kinase family protein [Ginsengibacter sp.]